MIMNPWRTGATLALTLAVSYTVYALLYVLFPERGIEFLNALFHGLNFRRLGEPMPFTFGLFMVPLLVFVVWGFLVGALYASLHNLLKSD